jgi:hypothetical protein
MRVLVAGATGAIGRPLIRGLRRQGHSVFCLVRSAESARMVTEMGAEALIGDAVDAASVRAAIARVRPDAVINELTSLPRHYTPAEMKAAAERDTMVRGKETSTFLQACARPVCAATSCSLRDTGMRPAQGWLTNRRPWLLMLHPASPPAFASTLNSNRRPFGNQKWTASRCVTDSFTDRAPGTRTPVIWASRFAGSRCRSSAPARACGVSSISRTPHPLPSRRLNVLRAPTTLLTTTRASSTYGCRRSHVLAGRRNRYKSPSRKLWRLLAPTACITRLACAAPPTRRPDTNSISARARSNGSEDEQSQRNMDEAQL